MCILKIYFSAVCDNTFQHLTEKEKIYQYSTPKVHRLLQILKTYTPFYTKENNTPEKKTNTGKNLFLLFYTYKLFISSIFCI